MDVFDWLAEARKDPELACSQTRATIALAEEVRKVRELLEERWAVKDEAQGEAEEVKEQADVTVNQVLVDPVEVAKRVLRALLGDL